MGVRLIAKDVDAEGFATEYSSPVRRALEAIHFTNTSLAKAAHNYAPGKLSGSIAGAPVPSSTSINAGSLVNYVQSAVAETDSMTFFCIAKSNNANADAASRPAFFGDYQGLAADGGLADGLIMFFSEAGKIAINGGYGNTAADKIFIRASLSSQYAANWALYIVEISPAGVTFKDITNNQTNSNTATTGLPRRKSLTKIRLGATPTAFAGTCDLAVWQAHSALLTAAEEALVVADLRAYALRKGIVV